MKSRWVIGVIAFFLCFMALNLSNVEAASTLTTKVNGKTYHAESIKYSGIWYIPIDAAATAQGVKGATGKTSYRVTYPMAQRLRFM